MAGNEWLALLVSLGLGLISLVGLYRVVTAIRRTERDSTATCRNLAFSITFGAMSFSVLQELPRFAEYTPIVFRGIAAIAAVFGIICSFDWSKGAAPVEISEGTEV